MADHADTSASMPAIEVRPWNRSITVAGVALPLSRREFQLLSVLVENHDRVITGRSLLDRVWGPGFSGDPSTLSVHIMRIRHKLASAHLPREIIVTVRGLGYRLDLPDSPTQVQH